MAKYRGFQNVWWLTFITIIIIIASSFVIGLFPDFFGGEYGALMTGEFLLIIPCVLGIILMKKKYLNENENTLSALGFSGFKPLLLPFLIVLPMSAQYFATCMTLHLSLLGTILFGSPDQGITTPSTAVGFAQMIISLCVLAPILEEILCRGIMMKYLEKYGVATEVLASGAAFAIMHFSMQSFVALLFVGILFGIIRKVTGSVFPSMIMHSVNNAASFIMIILTEKELLPDAALAVCALLLFIAFPFLIWGFTKLYKSSAHRIIFKPVCKAGISVGLILCITVFAVFHTALVINRIRTGEMQSEMASLIKESGIGE